VDRSFEDFGEVFVHRVPPSDLLACGSLVVTEAIYWKEKVKLAGSPTSLTREDGAWWLTLIVEGTTSEHLLKYLTGVPGRKIKGHLCPTDCPQELSGDSIVHLVKVRKAGGEREAEGWESNLLREGAQGEDDLRALREEARQVVTESRSPRRREGEKQAEKKEAKRKRDRSKKRSRKRSRSRQRSKKKGQKDLKSILGDSGLDPDPSRRKKMMKRAKKLVKKGKKKGDSSTTGSSGKEGTRSSSSSSGMGASDVFGQTRMAKKIWTKCPGVLTATSLSTVQEQLLTVQGQVWDIDRSELPPLFLQYFRAHLSPKMQPAMRREALHASFCLDLGLQGRIPELPDVLAQRLKALEGQTGGKHWTVTSQFELVPDEAAAVATSLETEQAAREAREQGRLKAQAAKPYGSNQGQDRWDDWKRDNPKGRPSKGAGKSKDWRKGEKGEGKDYRANREGDKEKDKNRGK